MRNIVYSFEQFPTRPFGHYIYQFVQNRKLTDVYHSHDFYEFILVLKGEGVQKINERDYSFADAAFCLLRPGDRHCFVKQTDEIRVISFSVEKKEFERVAEIYDSALCERLNSAADPAVFARGTAKIGASEFFCAEEADCVFLLSFLLRQYVAFRDGSADLPAAISFAMKEVRRPEYLKEGVSALVRLSNYSRTHLTRLMKRYCGICPHEYIFELRMNGAYGEIIFSDKSTEEIAAEFGFQSLSHFCRAFKKRFGTTPAELRRTYAFRTT